MFVVCPRLFLSDFFFFFWLLHRCLGYWEEIHGEEEKENGSPETNHRAAEEEPGIVPKDIVLPSGLLEGTVVKESEEDEEEYSTLKIFEKENWQHAYQFLFQYVRDCKENKKMVLAFEEQANEKRRNAEFFCHYNPTTLAFCLVTYINNFDVWKELAERREGDGQLESAQEESDGNDRRAKPKATSRYTKQKNASLELKTEYKKINTLTVVTIKHMMETEPTDKKFPNLWEEFLDGYFRYVWAVKAKKCEDIEKMNGQGKRKQPKERVKDSDEVCEDFLTSMGYAF